jgi:hypothetical protein
MDKEALSNSLLYNRTNFCIEKSADSCIKIRGTKDTGNKTLPILCTERRRHKAYKILLEKIPKLKIIS